MTTEVIAEPTAQQMWDAELAASKEPVTPAEPVVATEAVVPVPPVVVVTPVVEDPYAGLSPALRAKLDGIDGLAERLRKAEGHIGGLNSENTRIKTELAAAQAAAKTVTVAPTATQTAAAAKSTVKWDQLKTEFPEWAEAVEERLGGTSTQPDLDGLRNQIREELTPDLTASISAKLKAEIAAETEGRLTNIAHRGWRDTVKTQEFVTWYNAQPADVRALGASPIAEDAITLLDSYKAQQSVVPAVDPAAIKAARQARLAEAASLVKGGSTGAIVKSTDDMTEAEYWNYLAAQKAKQK